jgi:D-alanyl-D-alanine carboxypeptidase
MKSSPGRDERDVRGILAELGIGEELIRARALPLCMEAEELVVVESSEAGREYRLTPAAAAAWRRMQEAARAEGVVLQIASAFRSIERQVEIVRGKLARGDSLDTILAVSAPPGYSEHHTGCAVDVTTDGVAPFETEFEKTAAFRWLTANAARFGFILSYPPGNRHGYQYEPWHWCYRAAAERLKEGLRAIALFEALKGTLALLAAGGLLYAIPRDFRHIAEELVGRLHLNAGKSYPNVFNRIIEDTSNAQLWLIAALVVVYAVVRFAEGYGLWMERRWAEWLAALSGAIYVPVEIYELTRHVTWVRLTALVLNAVIVAYMCFVLWRTRRGT